MSNKVKDINLLEAYRKQTQAKASRHSSGKVFLAIFLVTALLLGAFTIKVLIDQKLLDDEVTELQDYVNNPTRLEKMREVEKMQSDIASLKSMGEEVTSLRHVMGQIPRYNRKVINAIDVVRPPGVKILSIDYDGSWVHLDVTAEFLPSMSNYVLSLERTNQFEEVYYDGYSASNGVYSGMIHVALKGNEVVPYE